MNKSARWISFGFMFLLILLYIQLFADRAGGSAENGGVMLDLHIKVIIDKSDSFFHSQFETGATSAGNAYGVYVEFEDLPKWENEALRESVTTAIKSGVDAVAFQSDDPDFVLEMYDLSVQCGVELLLFESENYRSIVK